MAEKKKEVQGNLQYYEQLRSVPQEALKPIIAGRLKGKSNIDPVWRIKAMTQAFGPCGVGWKYEIVKQWQEVYGQEVKAFTNINLFIKVDGEWSDAIPGNGGSTLVEISKSGLYVNDEGYKMALTDALSVAMKALGVAADVYFAGGVAESDNKYNQQDYAAQQQTQQPQQQTQQPAQQQMFTMAIQAEIDACADRNSLLAVWNKYPALWKDANFTGAVTARKDRVEQNGKS